ncbi:MAG: EVE domain-containing protein [Chloroflexi bacterium]|nr:EVE domain-containing protein [Chloroflexota bacterium]|tara:strand:+ start:3074 stop:3532 length:459 start_codon:yes stop_codon:yes gene_type:complete
MSYWLFKSEPSSYSWDDLIFDKIAEWDGVRNYKARNFLRDEIQVGDQILFYHSNSKPSCIVGIAEVVRSGYPDFTALDKTSNHFDSKSLPDNPIWFMVDIKPIEKLLHEISLKDIKNTSELKDMGLLKYARLSITPVSHNEFFIIRKMGGLE